MTGGRIIIDDPGRLLSFIEELEENVARLRQFFAQGFKMNQEPDGGPYDLEAIAWKLKDGSPATSEDPWAWAYAYDQDGSLHPETGALVEDVQDSPSARVIADGYEITLSKGRFLNRRLL